MSTALFLIALAMGYKVFAEATKEKHYLKTVGQVVGVAVMALSIVGTACSGYLTHKKLCGDKLGFKKGGMACPAPHWQAPAEEKTQK